MTVIFDYESKLQELVEDYKKKVAQAKTYSDILELRDDLDEKVSDLKGELEEQAFWVLRKIKDEMFEKKQEAKYGKEEKENE